MNITGSNLAPLAIPSRFVSPAPGNLDVIGISQPTDNIANTVLLGYFGLDSPTSGGSIMIEGSEINILEENNKRIAVYEIDNSQPREIFIVINNIELEISAENTKQSGGALNDVNDGYLHLHLKAFPDITGVFYPLSSDHKTAESEPVDSIDEFEESIEEIEAYIDKNPDALKDSLNDVNFDRLIIPIRLEDPKSTNKEEIIAIDSLPPEVPIIKIQKTIENSKIVSGRPITYTVPITWESKGATSTKEVKPSFPFMSSSISSFGKTFNGVPAGSYTITITTQNDFGLTTTETINFNVPNT
jgi:hypothetical protein